MTSMRSSLKQISALLIFLLQIQPLFAQEDSLQNQLRFFGGIDVYYNYDFNDPASGDRPGFLYSHTKHNGINVNTAYLGASYNSNSVRGNFALLAGDYSVSNYAAEEQLFQNVLEANIGIKLMDNLWLDAGVFSSHIGIEGAIGPDNPNLSRSLVAHNSPFFESGAKLSYQANEQWFFSFLVLNGWQNIADNNDNKAIGTQITYTPNDKLTLNSSSYFGEGNNAPSQIESFRYFHNFYVIWNATDRIYSAFAFDFGGDKLATRGTDEYLNWWGTALLLNYYVNDFWTVTGRLEYFHDPERVILNIFPAEHKISGISLGADFSPVKNAFLRFEAKWLNATEDIFEQSDSEVTERVNGNFAITTSLGISF